MHTVPDVERFGGEVLREIRPPFVLRTIAACRALSAAAVAASGSEVGAIVEDDGVGVGAVSTVGTHPDNSPTATTTPSTTAPALMIADT